MLENVTSQLILNKTNMATTSASDVLTGALLELRLPAAALEVPEVSALLRLFSKSSRTLKPSIVASQLGIVRLNLGRQDWEWDESDETGYDAHGDAFDYTQRTDLTLDTHRVSNLSKCQRQVSSALCTLGIPHDTVFHDGQNPGALRLSGRLNALDPRAPCSSHEVDTALTPPPDDILDQARACTTLEEFKALRDWLATMTEISGSLQTDTTHFGTLMTDPEWSTFMGACAGLLAWMPQQIGFINIEPKLDWEPLAPVWIQARWNGSDPMDRMVSLGCGGAYSAQHLKMTTRVALDQDPPQTELAGCAFNALCLKLSEAKNSKKIPTVSWSDSSFVGDTLNKNPNFVDLLSERARAVFDLNLAPAAPHATAADLSHAEVAWLGAQTTVARKKPLALARPRLVL